jgi:hypothetical protein
MPKPVSKRQDTIGFQVARLRHEDVIGDCGTMAAAINAMQLPRQRRPQCAESIRIVLATYGLPPLPWGTPQQIEHWRATVANNWSQSKARQIWMESEAGRGAQP